MSATTYSSVVKGHTVTKLTIRKSIGVHLQVFTCATGGVKGTSPTSTSGITKYGNSASP